VTDNASGVLISSTFDMNEGVFPRIFKKKAKSG